MASAKVDASQVEELKKPTEETTLLSPMTEATKPQDLESPLEEDEEEPKDFSLPDESGKEEKQPDEDDDDQEEDEKASTPKTVDDENDEDEDSEEQGMISAGRTNDFSEEEGDGDY